MALKVIHHRTCQAAATEAGRQLATLISKAKHPLLLLSGGSSLNAVRVMVGRLSPKDRKKLTIGQIDARIVPFSSDENNWKQIKDSLNGLINLDENMAMLKVGEPPTEAAPNYSALLQDKMDAADITIGLYGITPSGGIAGIQPQKEAHEFTKFLDGRNVVKYKGKDFSRLTTTSEVLTALDEVIILACGKDKHRAIMDLDKDLPPHEHPAQLLKDARTAVAYVHVGR